MWGYLGWDLALWDARLQAILHLLAAGALAALGWHALRGGELPRTAVDGPILVLLLAIGVASLTAWNAGLSARALTATLATAAMLPVALVALRHRPAWMALVVTVPIVGLATGTLAVLAARRLAWVLVSGPGLPPIRLANEGTPFGSVAVPPFMLLAALPLALLIEPAWLRRGMLAALVLVGLPLTVVSGSRSAWLAIGVAALVTLGPMATRLRLRPRWTRMRVGAAALGALAGLGAAVFAAALVWGRIGDFGSLVYRGFLWRDTLTAVASDPLMGIGPGGMPWARQAAAAPLSFPVEQPHSHNVLLGIYGDAGALGVVAALALVGWFVVVAGPWRARTLRGRAAFGVLAGFAGAMLFEDLTFLPNHNLLVVLLAGMALSEAGAVRWQPVRLRGLRLAAVATAAAALSLIMLLGDASAVAYRLGLDAASGDGWPVARVWLSRAVTLDPWHPAGPKTLAVVADHAGRPEEARAAAERAVALNPGDGLSWTNLAHLCLAAGDTGCASRAADQTAAYASAPGVELANAALVHEALGDAGAADRAYRLSLLADVWTGLVLPWPRAVDVDDALSELGEQPAQINLLVARRITGQAVDPTDYTDPAVRALAHAMVGEREAADAAMDDAQRRARGAPTTWALAALLAWHWGEDTAHLLAIHGAALGQQLELPAEPAGDTDRPLIGTQRIRDIAAFREYPARGLVRAAERLQPPVRWPWALEPLLDPAGVSRRAAGGG